MIFWLWLALFVIFLVVEALTVQLITVWFAVGAFCALIASFIIPDMLLVQIAVFVIVSAIALCATRPLVRKIILAKKVPTNVNSYIGAEGVVIDEINNIESHGLVKVNGSTWTARSDDGSVIENGTNVTVLRVEGVKLIVAVNNKEE